MGDVLNRVVSRAISDAAFRRELQTDPKSALKEFDLSAAEISAITSGDPSKLTALGVDQRMSRMVTLDGSAGYSSTVSSPDYVGGTVRSVDSPGISGSDMLDGDAAAAGLPRIVDPGTASPSTYDIGTVEGQADGRFAVDAEATDVKSFGLGHSDASDTLITDDPTAGAGGDVPPQAL